MHSREEDDVSSGGAWDSSLSACLRALLRETAAATIHNPPRPTTIPVIVATETVFEGSFRGVSPGLETTGLPTWVGGAAGEGLTVSSVLGFQLAVGLLLFKASGVGPVGTGGSEDVTGEGIDPDVLGSLLGPEVGNVIAEGSMGENGDGKIMGGLGPTSDVGTEDGPCPEDHSTGEDDT